MGSQGGISKSVNWQGGGEYIYMELAPYNQVFINEILACENIDNLWNTWQRIAKESLLNYKINSDEFNKNLENFNKLTLPEAKIS